MEGRPTQQSHEKVPRFSMPSPKRLGFGAVIVLSFVGTLVANVISAEMQASRETKRDALKDAQSVAADTV